MFKLIKILFLMNLREPLAQIWNLIFPIFLFVAIHFTAVGTKKSTAEMLQWLMPFFSYVIFSSSIYGVGLSLVAWRENGFLRTFVQDKFSKINIILSQVLLRIILNWLYTTSLFIVAIMLFKFKIDFGRYLQINMLVVLLTLLFSGFSLVFNAMQASFSTLSTTFSVLLAPMLIGSIIENSSPELQMIETINRLNLIDFGSKFLLFGIDNLSNLFTNVTISITVLILLFLSFIGIIYFKTYATHLR